MKSILILALLVTVSSCASKKKDRQEIQKKASQSTVSDGKALGHKIQHLINSSETLTDAQKKELNQIMQVNKQTADKLTEESFKFRGVLIKELLSGKPSARKVSLIKKDIKRIEDAKLKNTFDTVEKISNIVSTHPDRNQFAEHLIYFDRPGTTR